MSLETKMSPPYPSERGSTASRLRRSLPALLLLLHAPDLAAQPSGRPTDSDPAAPIVLNPFEVRTDRDLGYFSSATSAGTRTGMTSLLRSCPVQSRG